MAEQFRLIVDGALMEEVLNSAGGPVMRHLIRRADRIIVAARVQLEPHNRTKRLSRSIVKRPGMGPRGPMVRIVAGAGLADPNYAYWVHEGNGPEGGRIYPTKARVLAWVTQGERPTDAAGWKAARTAGTAVIARSVRTSKPIRYLTDNVHLAGGA